MPEDSACTICRDLPDFAAAHPREGERLPAAAAQLVDTYPWPEGFWDTAKDYEITKRCPLCGQTYTYNYHYEFSVGYIEEIVWLKRDDARQSGA
jgi:hypothetical protein